MNDREQEIYRRAFELVSPEAREDDERKHQEWLLSHTDAYGIVDLGQDEMVQKSVEPGALVYKTNYNALQVREESSAPMFTQDQVDVLAQFVSDYVHKKLGELEKKIEAKHSTELATLRGEIGILTKIARGEIASIGKQRDVA